MLAELLSGKVLPTDRLNDWQRDYFFGQIRDSLPRLLRFHSDRGQEQLLAGWFAQAADSKTQQAKWT